MKKNIINNIVLFGFIMLLPCFVFAQKVDMKVLREKILSEKHDFLQKELNLDTNKMKDFWTIYLEYDDAIFACHEASRKSRIDITGYDFLEDNRMNEDSLTNSQAQELINHRILSERKLLQIQEEYFLKFESVLPVQKVLKLDRLEKQFMRKVMQRDNKHKHQRKR